MKIIKQLLKLVNIKNSKQEKYLRSIFFELIQSNNGAITVMQFAMQADITGQEARKYLEQYAIEFEANFDTTEEGHVVYLFPVVNQTQNNSDNSNNSSQKTTSKTFLNKQNNSLKDQRVVNQTQNNSDNSNNSSQKTTSKTFLNKQNNSLNDNTKTKKHTPKVKTIVDVSAIEKDIQDIGKRVREIGDSFKL